ncbi:MAG: PorT family protein [Bacteroidales bacterium]|nr:PorT family protein [Bacteroidales bacterium]
MKKFFAIIAVAMASVMVANAQIGIVAGFGSSTTTINEEDLLANLNGVNDYHLGLAFKLPLPFGFAIQPELLYQIKGADLGQVVNGEKQADAAAEEFKFNDGFAELNLGVQWGLDLVAFRPFVFAKPFIGYRINEGEVEQFSEDTEKALNEAKNELEYGFSIGAGLDLLEHFQLSVEVFKNLGALYNADGEINASKEDIPDTNKLTDLSNYGGIKVSLGFFF